MNFDQPNTNENKDYETGLRSEYSRNISRITESSQDFWGRDERIQSANRSAAANPGRKAGAKRPKRRRRKLKRPDFSRLANIRLPRRQAPKKKRTPVTAACISGLLCAALVLFTEVGIWGLYCFSRGLPGDTNANASTFMYCFAVFAGCFWAGAVVKRRSLKPVWLLCGVFMGLSLIISLRMFPLAEFKLKMIMLKLLFTLVAAMLGFVLSLAPYLIHKGLKQRRQAGSR